MKRSSTQEQAAVASLRSRCARTALAFAAVSMIALSALPAGAVDGCKVLLCLAAPDWKKISDCVPTINELNRDLAKGRPFPACQSAGPGNSASHQWASAPSNCPPQYTRVDRRGDDTVYSCDYAGAVTVSVNGAPFTRTWWSADGNTVTEFTPAAKAQLGNWDAQFDNDYAHWLTLQAPAASACTDC